MRLQEQECAYLVESVSVVLLMISLQQLQYDSLIHLLPLLVVIAINSISLAIGIGVIFFLLSERGPVESKKRNVLACPYSNSK